MKIETIIFHPLSVKNSNQTKSNDNTELNSAVQNNTGNKKFNYSGKKDADAEKDNKDQTFS